VEYSSNCSCPNNSRGTIQFNSCATKLVPSCSCLLSGAWSFVAFFLAFTMCNRCRHNDNGPQGPLYGMWLFFFEGFTKGNPQQVNAEGQAKKQPVPFNKRGSCYVPSPFRARTRIRIRFNFRGAVAAASYGVGSDIWHDLHAKCHAHVTHNWQGHIEGIKEKELGRLHTYRSSSRQTGPAVICFCARHSLSFIVTFGWIFDLI